MSRRKMHVKDKELLLQLSHLLRLFTRKQSPNASAAAVPSSSREELATSSPVSSDTIVW